MREHRGNILHLASPPIYALLRSLCFLLCIYQDIIDRQDFSIRLIQTFNMIGKYQGHVTQGIVRPLLRYAWLSQFLRHMRDYNRLFSQVFAPTCAQERHEEQGG